MLRLVQQLKLQQKLDFRMIQSLKLLPLTITQLEQRINEELEQNPMLQLDESQKKEEQKERENESRKEKAETESAGDERSGDFTEAEWTKYIEDGFDTYSPPISISFLAAVLISIPSSAAIDFAFPKNRSSSIPSFKPAIVTLL